MLVAIVQFYILRLPSRVLDAAWPKCRHRRHIRFSGHSGATRWYARLQLWLCGYRLKVYLERCEFVCYDARICILTESFVFL